MLSQLPALIIPVCHSIYAWLPSALQVDPVRNLIYVRGQVPGHKGNFVLVKDAVMKQSHQQPERPFPTYLGPSLTDVLTAPTSEKDPFDYQDAWLWSTSSVCCESHYISMDRHAAKWQPQRLMLFAISVSACVWWCAQLSTNFCCQPTQQAAQEFSKHSVSCFLMLYKRFVLKNPLATVLVRLSPVHNCLQSLPLKWHYL